ncbi:MAG: threonine/serine exporter [Lachnospiraceae bacterium]|nr:threonine/serine exporter [Lachnospiraceae bacterium]
MTVLRIIMAFFAIMGFAVVLNAPRKELICCGMCGLVSFAVYVALSSFLSPVVSVFIATVVAMAFARICSYRRKSPSTMYVIMGILPHVPGAGMYFTMYGIINSDLMFSYMKGVETFKTAGVIAMGVILVFLLPPGLFTIGMREEK